MRFPLAFAVLAVLVVAGSAAPPSTAKGPSCARQPVSPAYAGSVRRALGAKQDVWGNALIARPNGPTYGSVRRLLKPLLFARSKTKSLTTSGVYYLPFAQPLGVRGAHMVALHVADGSEILSQTAKGPSVKVFVGATAASATARVCPAWPLLGSPTGSCPSSRPSTWTRPAPGTARSRSRSAGSAPATWSASSG